MQSIVIDKFRGVNSGDRGMAGELGTLYDARNVRIDPSGIARTRMSFLQVSTEVGKYAPGYTATITGTNTVTISTVTDLGVTMGLKAPQSGTNLWLFISDKGTGYVTGYTSGNAFTSSGLTNGTTTNWRLVYVGLVNMIARHYDTQSSTKKMLVQCGNLLGLFDSSWVWSVLKTDLTYGYDLSAIQLGDTTYMGNRVDLPLKYDLVNGLRLMGTASLSTPGNFLYLMSQLSLGGGSAFPSAEMVGARRRWRIAQAPNNFAPGQHNYGSLSNDCNNYPYVMPQASGTPTRNQNNQRYVNYNEEPWFFVPDAVKNKVTSGAVHTNGASTDVLICTVNPITAGVAAGDILAFNDPLLLSFITADYRSQFYYVVSVTSTTIKIDRVVTIALAAAKNYWVFKNQAGLNGSITLNGNFPTGTGKKNFCLTNFANGASATSSPLLFPADTSPGDLIIAFLNKSDGGTGTSPIQYDTGDAATVVATGSGTGSGATSSFGGGLKVYKIRSTAAAALNWMTGYLIEGGFRSGGDPTLPVLDLDGWEVSTDGAAWNPISCNPQDRISYYGTDDNIGTDASGLSYVYVTSATLPVNGPVKFRYRGPTSALITDGGNVPYRIGVISTTGLVSGGQTNSLSLFCHNGPVYAATRFAVIKGRGGPVDTSDYSIDLFRSAYPDDGNFYEVLATILGIRSNPSGQTPGGIQGCCVGDGLCGSQGTQVQPLNNPPPRYAFAVEHLESLFCFDVENNDGLTLYPYQYRFSQPQAFETFPGFNQKNVSLRGNLGRITFAEIINQTLYIYRDRGVFAADGSNARGLFVKELSKNVGCLSWRVGCSGDNRIFTLGHETVWMFDGVGFHDVGEPIRNVFESATEADRRTWVMWYKTPYLYLATTGNTGTRTGSNPTTGTRRETWVCDTRTMFWMRDDFSVTAVTIGDSEHDSGYVYAAMRPTVGYANFGTNGLGQVLYRLEVPLTDLSTHAMDEEYEVTSQTKFSADITTVDVLAPAGKLIKQSMFMYLKGLGLINIDAASPDEPFKFSMSVWSPDNAEIAVPIDWSSEFGIQLPGGHDGGQCDVSRMLFAARVPGGASGVDTCPAIALKARVEPRASTGQLEAQFNQLGLDFELEAYNA